MAYGTANVDVIQSSTAGTPPQFNDGNGTQVGTLCRAWVNYKGTATRAINASFNVSSVTFSSTGIYIVNFTTAFPDANYCMAGSASYVGGSGQPSLGLNNTGQTTTSATISNVYATTNYDSPYVCAAFFR